MENLLIEYLENFSEESLKRFLPDFLKKKISEGHFSKCLSEISEIFNEEFVDKFNTQYRFSIFETFEIRKKTGGFFTSFS